MHFVSWKSVVVLCVLGPCAYAQTTLTLRQMTASAGYIFAGTVTAVQRAPAHSNEVETIRITFRIDEGVRGVRTRQSLTIREWAGLWNAGERYQLGEQVVLMLYPPSKLGLTSPVGGSLGRFALDLQGDVALPIRQNDAVTSDPVAGPWLQTRPHARGRDFARILRRVAKE